MKQMTSFLPDDYSWAARRWHILNGVYEPVKCHECDNLVKWSAGKYPKYCSTKCIARSDEVKNKKQKIALEKYGVTCSFLADEPKKKRQKTIEERYGVEHVSQSDIVKEKKKQTLLKNYGVEQVLQSKELSDKMKDTLMKKYGVEYAAKLDHVKQKTKKTCLERYGVDSYIKTVEFWERYKKKCLELYGVDSASQSEIIKQKKKQTNLQKYGREYATQSHISIENLSLLNDKNWLIQKHHIEKLDLQTIGNILGVDGSTVGIKCKQLNIDVKRYFTSSLERELREFIYSIYENDILLGNRKILNNNKEIDIYLPQLKLAIEFNGLFWHSEFQMSKSYHYEKYKECSELGITLIQIFEDEWNDKKNIIKQKLLYMIKKCEDKIQARKCDVDIPSKEDKKYFFNTNHIQGDGDSSFDIGLYHAGSLVACMSFKKRNDTLHELSRYATSNVVQGGFSKLLKHATQSYIRTDIVSFADLRWSNGLVYEKNGFDRIATIPPDYYWIKRDKRFHKFNFRHSRMKNKLDKYDENLTEVENMHNNNYYRIYDAGKLKYFRKAQQ